MIVVDVPGLFHGMSPEGRYMISVQEATSLIYDSRISHAAYNKLTNLAHAELPKLSCVTRYAEGLLGSPFVQIVVDGA